MSLSRNVRPFPLALLSGLCCAGHVEQPTTPCNSVPYPGPAVLTDTALYKEGHPGARIIDYGVRESAGEFRRELGVECRVLHDPAPVAQWIARPPPNQLTHFRNK